MKFGKRLQSQLEETIPEWRDKYLCYKQLKKRLKLIAAPECFTEAAFSSPLREEKESVVPKSVVDAAVEELKREHADQEENVAAATTSEGQDSSLIAAAGTVTEETSRKSSSGSAGIETGLNPSRNLTAEEEDFINLLNAELEKFNTFFIEKEEEYVIRLQELKERIENLKEKSGSSGSTPSDTGLNEELINIRKDIVSFHGEMVLLENYSSLNYTGLVKILKKHDKRTGSLLRMPFIQNVLHQPFFTTELLSKLVRECEMNLQSLFPCSSAATANEAAGTIPPKQDPPIDGLQDAVNREKENNAASEKVVDTVATWKESTNVDPQGQLFYHGEDVENIYRSTVAALRTIKELRRGSSTYSVFSLPPFNRNENDSEDGDSKITSPCCATIPVCAKK